MAQNDPNPPPLDEYWHDRDATKNLTPLFSSRVFVQDAGGGMVRVSFGELLNGEAHYYAAFVLTASTALEVAAIMAKIALPIISPPPQMGVPTAAETPSMPPNG